MSRQVYLFIGLLVSMGLMGCSTSGLKKVNRNPVKEEKVQYTYTDGSQANTIARTLPRRANYSGISGYLSRPPIFSDKLGASVFKRCEPFTIESVRKIQDSTFVTIRQGNNTIEIVGINRKPFRLGRSGRLSLLNSYFVKRLDVLQMRPKRDIASAKQHLCGGSPWKNMTKQEFLFLNGDPEKVTRKVVEGRNIEDWVYKNSNKEDGSHYYFHQNLLYAWQ